MERRSVVHMAEHLLRPEDVQKAGVGQPAYRLQARLDVKVLSLQGSAFLHEKLPYPTKTADSLSHSVNKHCRHMH